MAGSRTLKLSILADVDNLKKNLDTGSKEVEGFGGKLEKFGKVAAAAFAAAAAAAAAYAVKLAVDGVKAAIEDEAAQLRLANALKNVTGATESQIAAVEEQILKLSLANGIADDQLRPAFQRLATATGSLTKAGESLNLALDISAATGKSVEAVSNALGKAYEGNTTALTRLGIGLSAAEVKALGLDGTMEQLADTFEGAATVQANTLEGQIARLKILFDETQESVGQGLLPAVKAFIDYVTNRLIPMLIEAKQKAIDPISDAFARNQDEIRALWKFTKEYLVPIFEFTLVGAIKNVGSAIGTITNIIGSVIRGIEGLVNKAIEGINFLIDQYNKIPDWAKPGGDITTLRRVNWTPNTSTTGRITTSTGSINIRTPFVDESDVSSITTRRTTTGTTTTSDSSRSSTTTKDVSDVSKAIDEQAKKLAEAFVDQATWMPTRTGTVAGFRAAESGDVINMPGIPTNFDVARVRAADAGITINVNAPSIVDEEGFSRALVDALNKTQARTGGGGGQLIL